MRNRTLAFFLLSLFLSGCGGSFVMERVDVENGILAGDEVIDVDNYGRVTNYRQEGYLPGDRYLKSYEYGDDNLGPNAPGYIP